MPRPNYMIAWNALKDILTMLIEAKNPPITAAAIHGLMMELEHRPVDWSNLYEILQHLKAPTRH